MSENYVLKSFKVGDFKDNYGNTWCEAIFEGYGEPVKWVVKDPSRIKEGETYYGRVEDKTSKAGKPYARFYAEQKEDSPKPKQDDAYWQDKQDTIMAEWAIGQAVSASELKASDDNYFADIEHLANQFFKMVDRVAKQEPAPDPALTDEDYKEEISVDDIPY